MEWLAESEKYKLFKVMKSIHFEKIKLLKIAYIEIFFLHII